MSVMMERLASESHLKHWGLQQLSLFLKAIGLPMEQALLFFRQQFAPRCAYTSHHLAPSGPLALQHVLLPQLQACAAQPRDALPHDCHFLRSTSGEKFARQYAYSLRYNYGQEGKREDWSEYSCVRIINQVGNCPCCQQQYMW